MGFNWWGEPDGNSGTAGQDAFFGITERRRQQIQAEDRRAVDDGLWPNGWPHDAPQHRLGVYESHTIMQQHRGCRAEECPRKHAARQLLIEANRMKPDTSREH